MTKDPPIKSYSRIVKSIGAIIVASSFAIPYIFEFPGKFVFGTFGIIWGTILFFKQSWRLRAGLQISFRHFIASLLLLISFSIVGRTIIVSLLNESNARILNTWSIVWKIMPFFQAMNEEIVIRALLLSALLQHFKNKAIVSVVTAVLFGALHFLFYKYNLQGSNVLDFLCLINLVLFGLFCNYLFIKYRHIGFSIAIHAGWNLTRFSGPIVRKGHELSEGQTFNILESSPLVTALLLSTWIILVTVSFIKDKRRKSISETEI